MKVSIVTISFNQIEFLKECIESVLSQNYDNLEYIIVDPGSTDGSRDLIESYGEKIISLFESDDGPSDGLNKGFSKASGDIFGFLNSDDYFLPNAIKNIVDSFNNSQTTDVISGHSLIVDEQSNTLRKFYSDRMSLGRYAYQGVILSQPSTFFRSSLYKKTSGFNVDNRSNWDGELFSDFAILGSKFSVINKILSAYRLQKDSITSTGKLLDSHKRHLEASFEKIMNRRMTKFDLILCIWFRFLRKILNPRDTLERIKYGPIFLNKKTKSE